MRRIICIVAIMLVCLWATCEVFAASGISINDEEKAKSYLQQAITSGLAPRAVTKATLSSAYYLKLIYEEEKEQTELLKELLEIEKENRKRE